LQKREGRNVLLKKNILWLFLRVSILTVLFVSLEVTFRMGLLAFFGSQDIQVMVYSVLQKILFTLVVWFVLGVTKRITIPTVIIATSPAISKLIREPVARRGTFQSIQRYLTYIAYLVVFVSIILIWAYSFIGTWIVGFLGTGLIVALTFILGLFTSSVLGNVLAYLILDGTTEFKKGDRVQIGDSYGDIVELGFFFTHIKTIKDEMISIPNLAIMGKEVRNFSALKRVLIHIPVTLGYDTDKDEAKRLLIESAEMTKDILLEGEKKPFVLLTDLGNYTITYEINAYTDKPNELINIKSELIDNILNNFKKFNVEILSPTHIAVRRHPMLSKDNALGNGNEPSMIS
jgi:small-conductance mechanosensitive channel